VKASGTHLADAERRAIFVEVDLAEARAMAQGGPAPAGSQGLRPSIETSLHAVLPHAYVAHFHAVEVLAFAVREDGEAALQKPLAGLRWGWVPYVKPGVPLAAAVVSLLERQPVDFIVLGNHGVIIGGDSCAEIDQRLSAIRERLTPQVRKKNGDREKLAALADRFGLDPVRYEEAHWSAADPTNLAYATAGTLYPDHVVFLGRGAALLGENGAPEGAQSILYLAPGVGALLPPGAPAEAHQMAACLGAVTARIAPDVRLRPLAAEEEGELLTWEAETYRQSLAKRRRSEG
jgi:rhamnose utilization protein RhaD (predicted bifunctional aldolase and dehydrogenase)